MARSHVERKLHILAGIILGGFILAHLYHHYIPPIFGWGYPANTYFFMTQDMFNDWVNLARKSGAGNPYLIKPEFAPFVYFPFAYFLFLPFSFLPPRIYLPGFVVGNVLIAVFLARWVAIRTGLAQSWTATACLLIITLLNYPFQFALDRGNLDLWIGFLCLAFAILFWNRQYWPSVPFLAAAVAIKGYPAVFLLLYILERQYRPALGTMLLALFLNLLAVLVLPGGFSDTWQGFLTNLAVYKKDYIVGAGSMHFSSDLFSLIKILVHLGKAGWSIEKILPWYSLAMFGLLLLSAFYALFAETPKWKKILFLTLAGLLFPHITNDYKLNLLLIPAIAMVIDPHRSANDDRILVILGLVLIPKAYGRLINDASLSCLLNPLLLFSLVGILLCEKGVMSEAVRQVRPKLQWYLFRHSLRK
jgi:hypothetical protein